VGPYELTYLIKGSVSFVDESRRDAMFLHGHIFLIEQKVQCNRESREHVTKVYVIFRPA
jgi:uncharacterized cupin superfamily protein